MAGWAAVLALLALLALPVLPVLPVLPAVPAVPRRAAAGCAARGLCCPGRDPACLSHGRRPDGSRGPCYCDQACARTLDCCHDYAETCPAVPCVVSQWSAWSGCAEPCRTTYRVRRRRVLREPRNGGERCPALEERAGCVRYPGTPGAECRRALVPALITTGGFGKARRKRAAADGDDRTGYCVEFQLAAVAPGCLRSHRSHTRWTLYLREGHTACVECQRPAWDPARPHCHGDGNGSRKDQLLHWQAVGNPQCQGTWRRIRQRDTCSCPSVHSFLFI